ncbi:hypothetical protein PPTG_07597 [Phytophthora nicotianae INRA-310]|uniref:Uncharacterized protein n=1 Tax=Phytophthora nicotianae (strain INRA-310) TaxID=761204 RepID=W2QN05_PHYN3|nr:hypothetical protein PPTG_07597 [Phytophthora nicotianae INRA-310]ETN14582.1 hypothetical protein PPTG_07597 [Phytophthora nicotianae INRA-310]
MVRISTNFLAVTAALAVLTLPDSVDAHGGQSVHARTPERLAQRRLFMSESKRSLKDCAGHYTSRATHIHILGTYNGTLLENNTYSGGYASHVGQLFFDQDLISEVELTAPYSTNTQELTTNAEDQILSEEAAEDFDPFFEYVLLGDSVSDGVLAWISVGVDMTRAQTITAAGTLTADGGVMSESTNAMGGGGGMGPGSGMGGTAPGSGMGGFGGSVGGPEGSFNAASSETDVTQSTTTGVTQSTTSGSVAAEASDPACSVRL